MKPSMFYTWLVVLLNVSGSWKFTECFLETELYLQLVSTGKYDFLEQKNYEKTYFISRIIIIIVPVFGLYL